MDLSTTPLLTDLYQLNMIQAYLEHGKTESAVFEFFVRKLPHDRNFLVAAGLEQALDFLEALRFSPEEIAWLKQTGRFGGNLLEALSSLQFTGDVDAMAEGTVFFPNEPILRIVAPLPQAQLVETRLINILHFQTLIASKAARMAQLVPGKQLVDFGLRRAHGAEAGLMAARASYIGGFAGTATLLAGRNFGIPVFGTMAHSFIEAFDDEGAAFAAFAQSRPDHLVLLVDTYDVEAAAKTVVTLTPTLEAKGIAIRGIRLDSGDLIAQSRTVRRILDDGGLGDVTILASGGLDEKGLIAIMQEKAPIDGFGIGTSLTTSFDVPALDCAYKLQEYAGRARRKQSPGKATWPGRKQVWRGFGTNSLMTGDILSLEDDRHPGETLLQPVMRAGKRLSSSPPIAQAQARASRDLERLPQTLRGLEPNTSYPVQVADALLNLTRETDRWLKQHR